MKNRRFCFYLLLLTVFFCGFITGKIFDVPGLVIDKHINLLHAASILVTLLIALVITVFFQTNKDVNNIANGIIIKRIDNVIEIIDTLQDDVEIGSIATERAPSVVKRIHGSLKCIWTNIDEQSIKVSTVFQSLEDETRKINDLLTNTPAKGSKESTSPVSVKSGKYSYNPARISEIATHIESLKNNLFKTQLEVNKSLQGF
jgi:hypothetical protein